MYDYSHDFSKILDLQMRAVRQRQRKETSKKCEKDKRQHDKVKLFCRKCQVFACSGVDIRCIKEAHHVVIDKDFTSKFYFKKSKCPRVFNEIELTGMSTLYLEQLQQWEQKQIEHDREQCCDFFPFFFNQGLCTAGIAMPSGV